RHGRARVVGRNAVRGARHAAQPGEHDRRRHDRGQQEHSRRTRARSAPGTRSVAGCALERDPEELNFLSYPELETLIVERRGAVGWLINNRPAQLNAMNSKMRDEFELAWRALDDDPEVRVIVHTGEGRAFQTGVDVSEIASDGVGMQRYRESV